LNEAEAEGHIIAMRRRTRFLGRADRRAAPAVGGTGAGASVSLPPEGTKVQRIGRPRIPGLACSTARRELDGENQHRAYDVPESKA